MILIALIGAVAGPRRWVIAGGLGMVCMNGHDAVFMGLTGGADMRVAANAGLVFAGRGVVSIVLVAGTVE